MAGYETTELRFAYDAWNRLVQVRDASDTEIARYYHDGLNRRIHKALPAGGGDWYTGDWYYNLSWQLLEDRHKDEPVNDPKYVGTTVRYQAVWSLRYIDAPVLFDAVAEPSRTYLLNDANMNVTAALSASGVIQERTVYDPYGRPTFYSASWTCYGPTTRHTPNPFLFCGYYYDAETGLYQVRNRVYHPGLGRWVQRDPAGYQGGSNLYLYALSSPLTELDPLGLDVVIQEQTIYMAGLIPVMKVKAYFDVSDKEVSFIKADLVGWTHYPIGHYELSVAAAKPEMVAEGCPAGQKKMRVHVVVEGRKQLGWFKIGVTWTEWEKEFYQTARECVPDQNPAPAAVQPQCPAK